MLSNWIYRKFRLSWFVESVTIWFHHNKPKMSDSMNAFYGILTHKFQLVNARNVFTYKHLHKHSTMCVWRGSVYMKIIVVFAGFDRLDGGEDFIHQNVRDLFGLEGWIWMPIRISETNNIQTSLCQHFEYRWCGALLFDTHICYHDERKIPIKHPLPSYFII